MTKQHRRQVWLISCILCLIGLLSALFVADYRDLTKPPVEAYRSLQLILAPDGKQSKDRIVMNLEVVNAGNLPLGWDTEFSVGLEWHLRINDKIEVQPWHKAERAQLWVVRELEGSDARPRPDRFVLLKPGERLRKQIELTKSNRQFGVRMMGGTAEIGIHPVPSAAEVMAKFIVPELTPPEPVRSIRAEVAYQGSEFYRLGRFRETFGSDPYEVRLSQGYAASNTVDLELK